MIVLGSIVNAVAVMVGGSIGVVFKKGIPERVKTIMMQSIGVCVLYVGISGSLKGHNTIYIVISMVIGAIIGELIDFDNHFNYIGKKAQNLFKVGPNSFFAEGFVTSSLFICVGAMAIVGSLQSGLTGSNSTLMTKSVIDGIFCLIMASTLGLGVAFAGVTVFIYEAAITLLAHQIAGFFTSVVIDEVTCVGSLLILIIGLNMLKLTNIKVANLLLAPFIPIFLYQFFS